MSNRPTATLSLTALFAAAAAAPLGAEVPTAPPVFSAPLTIDNDYAPFEPGAVHTYRGKSDGERTCVVALFLEDTRDFSWGGGTVATRVLQETEFEDGHLIEVSWNYFAQGDDGAVYYFGEVVDIYEDGQVVDHDGSWLVGGATLPGDPAGTAAATDPALFMPGNPEVGDQFKPEDLFPLVDETVTVKKVGKKLKVEAGKFQDVIQVKETSDLPDSDPEWKWYAKGIGVIATKADGEKLALIATTLLQDG